MIIGFWISLFIFIMSFITSAIKICYCLESDNVIIFGLLIGISIFGMIFFGYYASLK
jgi:hypothetical protein